MIGKAEWKERSIYDDEYEAEEEMELSPLDGDYVREEYREKDE